MNFTKVQALILNLLLVAVVTAIGLQSEIARAQSMPVNITHIVELNGVIYCIGNTDEETSVVAKISFPHPPLKKIEIVSTIQDEKIERILEVKKDRDRLVLTSKTHQYILANGAWEEANNPRPKLYQYNDNQLRRGGLPSNSFGLPLVSFREPDYKVQQQMLEIEIDGKMHHLIIWNKKISAGGYARPDSGIYDIQDASVNFYPLPQPSYELFRKFRPERVKDGYTEEDTSLITEIGAFQLDGSQVNFGLNFYDGEGTTGVGGIGFFDILTKKFEISYRKDIADFSVFSMLVDTDSIWLGLGVHPEGIDYSQGMAKINRQNNSLVRYKIPGLVNTIVRVGGTIYAGTSKGIIALGDDGGIENMNFSVNKDGIYSAIISKEADIVRKK